MVGMGINKYFSDNWNKFDFMLVVISLMLSVTLTVLRVTKNLVSTRGVKFLRYTRGQKFLKATKWIRNNKFLGWIFSITDSLRRIKLIILKALMLITSFLRILSVMFLTFYLWAVIGTQLLYHTDEQLEAQSDNEDLSYYAGSIYGNFQTFPLSMIALFQLLTGSSWHMIVLYTEVFNGFWITCLILVTFHMFITFIMRSILLGFIWEVFAVVNDMNNEQNESNTVEENLLNLQVMKQMKDFKKEKETAVSIDMFKRLDTEHHEDKMETPRTKSSYLAFTSTAKTRLIKEIFSTSSCDIIKLKRLIRRRKQNNIQLGKHYDYTSSNYFAKEKLMVKSQRRSRSGQKTKPINFDSYHIEIELVCHELEELDQSCDISSTISAKTRYEHFSPGKLDEVSDIFTEQILEPNRITKSMKPNKEERKLLLRKTSTVYFKELLTNKLNSDSDDSEGKIEFDGDFLLKKALLQNHDLQALKIKEMQYVLLKSCTHHTGKDEEGKRLMNVYTKPEVKEVREEEVNTQLMIFMREIRMHDDT